MELLSQMLDKELPDFAKSDAQEELALAMVESGSKDGGMSMLEAMLTNEMSDQKRDGKTADFGGDDEESKFKPDKVLENCFQAGFNFPMDSAMGARFRRYLDKRQDEQRAFDEADRAEKKRLKMAWAAQKWDVYEDRRPP
eukprot:6584395-Pyramimonas_sp.AAC.1